MFNRKTRATRRVVRTINHLYHGIAIEPGTGACASVRAVAGHRFLSDDAPRLPVDGCTRGESCRCVYRHFPDRRTDVRRESDMGLPTRHIPHDKRYGHGRRITDA